MEYHQYFEIPGFAISDFLRAPPGGIEIMAKSLSTQAKCPYCQTFSKKKHSHYIRRPKSLPWGEFSVKLNLIVNRYFCKNIDCIRVTFVERIPQIACFHAQRTVQLTKILRAIAFETSGEVTARISKLLHMEVSPDTVLRILRATYFSNEPTPRILGIDDWALKRGQHYGTILVNLETRKPVDLIQGRSAETLQKWLEAHPQVQVISRDRSKEYKAGIDAALPDVLQIVDRWHLYRNLRERIEKILAKRTPKSRKPSEKTVSHRQKWFDHVRYLHARGYSSRVIARALDMNRGTVINYIKSDHLPDWNKGVPRRSKLEKYDNYLRKRWREGEHSATILWKELKHLGYEGKLKSVRRYLRRYQENRGRSPRQTAWLFITEPGKLDLEDATYLNHLLDKSEPLTTVYELSQEFINMLSNRDNKNFDNWLRSAEQCGVKVFENFAIGIRQDYDAVKSAFISEWSNGQTEGQVTRLKLIKRQMYGRANFDLLRIRVLGPP